MKKKRIWRRVATAGTLAFLACRMGILMPYASVNLAGQAEYEVSGTAECRRLLMEVVSSARGNGRREIYVTGKDYEPETLVVAQMFPEVINISNTKLRTYKEDGHEFTVCRIGFEWKRDAAGCEHVLESETLEESSCLRGGMERSFCRLCGFEERMETAALGHADSNGDSLCDRCGGRFLAQRKGDVIAVTYAPGEEGEVRRMEFCCTREVFGGGMLYESLDTILVSDMAEAAHEVDGNQEERARWWLRTDFYHGISVKPACLDVLLLDPAGEPVEDGAWAGEAEGRIGLVLTVPEAEEGAEKNFWAVGDIQLRRLGQKMYRFRCIDDDYRDSNSNYQRSALFLCETVIRSDVDSTDSQRKILVFGKTNEYKKSEAREWLKINSEGNAGDVMAVFTGVNSAYEGQTPDGMFGQMTGQGLVRRGLPFQLAEDRLFLLSVEEALEYREELWDPEGSGSPYSRGYWLRTPAFLSGQDGEFINGTWEYAVDLERGCLRPAEVTDAAFGIRPAYCLPQA